LVVFSIKYYNLVSMQKEITIVIVFCEDKPNLVFKCLEKIKNFNIIIVNNIGNTFFRININKILLKI
jgi:hypothetical protein